MVLRRQCLGREMVRCDECDVISASNDQSMCLRVRLTGSIVAVGTASGTVQLWDAAKQVMVREITEHTQRVGASCWSSAHCLATGSRDHSVLVHDIRLPSTTPAVSSTTTASPRGSTSRDFVREIAAAMTSSGRRRRSLEMLHLEDHDDGDGDGLGSMGITSFDSMEEPTPFRRLSASADASSMPTSSSATPTSTPAHRHILTSLYSPEDEIMLSPIQPFTPLPQSATQSLLERSDIVDISRENSSSNNISSASRRSRSTVIMTLESHSQEVCGLKWSPDGQQLASGGNDNVLCVWDIAGASRSSSINTNRQSGQSL